VSCSERNLRTGSLSQACEMKMIKQLLYRFHSLFVETEGCNGNAEYSLIASNTSKILFLWNVKCFRDILGMSYTWYG
jgi:hypothetical protein